MPLPAHRIGTSEFFDKTGISKTQFYNEYRWEPHWVERFDMRIDDRSGQLNMSRKAVENYVARLSGGRPATRPSQKSLNLGDHATHAGSMADFGEPGEKEGGTEPGADDVIEP